MKASEWVKKLEKRATQTYAHERDMVNAILYLMRFRAATEADVARQLDIESMDEEGN